MRKRVSPRVEKLKKQIDNLWPSVLIVEEGKSALNGFAKEFFVKGDDSLPQESFPKARGPLVGLMKNTPKTKVKMILHCLLVKTDLVSGEEIEADPFFHSDYHPNSDETNRGEILDEMERK